MQCPFCGHSESQVKDSRPVDENVAIRRRRFCSACAGRFTTFERIQLRDLMIIKASGTREIFSRDKLYRSLSIALRKRPVDDVDVARLTNSIIRRLEASGEEAIPSRALGVIVMESLGELDPVAYVRYASVYQNFEDLTDFKDFLKAITREAESATLEKREGA